MARSKLCGGLVGTSFDSRHWLSLDPCGLLCCLLSLSVHIFALIVIICKLISHSLFSQTLFGLCYLPCATLALSSLFMGWKTDPGSVPMGARPLTTFKRSGSQNSSGELEPSKQQRAIRRCHKCNDNYKPPRAHHDSVTGRCIVKFDHFCPWVGNAVGALNHKFFVLFIFYTLCTSILSLVLIVIRLVHCAHVRGDSSDDSHEEEEWSEKQEAGEDPSRFLKTEYVHAECEQLWDGSNLVLILLVVAVVFLVFTLVMLVEQLDAIESNQSKIARMKLRVGQGGTELTRVTHDFNEMFGGNSPNLSWHWFLPLSVQFPKGMDKIVLGYEWDETFDPVPYQEPGDEADGGGDGENILSAVVDQEKAEATVDLESGLETSSMASLGEESTSEYSVRSARMRKRDGGAPPTFIDRPENRIT